MAPLSSRFSELAGNSSLVKVCYPGLSVATGERVSNVESLTPNCFQKDMVVRTEKGTEVVVDMVVLCTGIKINSSAYAAAFGKCKTAVGEEATQFFNVLYLSTVKLGINLVQSAVVIPGYSKCSDITLNT